MNRFYFKHLVRTVRKKPLQPLLITLILVLSFLILCVTFSAAYGLKEEERLRTAGTYGNADAIIRTGSASPSRFLFPEDVDHVCETEAVTSSFVMPFLSGGLSEGRLISGIAVPFSGERTGVNAVFDLRFVSYEPIYRGEIRNVCLITSALAKEMGLSVGDVLSLEAFGKPVSYTVKGISEKPFLGSNQVLVDISGAVGLLIGDPAISSLLGDAFSPGGTLYIRFKDGADPQETFEKLQAAFPAYSVSLTRSGAESISTSSMRGVSAMILILSVLCAFSVVYCCTFCMARERGECAALFAVCGASGKRLLGWMIGENVFYALLGCLAGTLLSFPVGRFTFRQVGFSYLRFTFVPRLYLLAALPVFAVAALTPIFLRKSSEKRRKAHPARRVLLILLPLLAIGTAVLSHGTSGMRKFPVAAVGLVLVILTAMVSIPPLFRRTAGILAKRFSARPGHVSLSCGLKNASEVPALSNSARLATVVLTIVTAAFFGVMTGWDYIRMVPTAMNAEFAVTGGTMRAREPLAELDDAAFSSGFIFLEGSVGGRSLNAWATEDARALSDFLGIDTLPHGAEILTSGPYALGYGFRDGETVTVTLNSATRDVTVRVVDDSDMFFILFDADYFGIPFNTYLVKAAPGVSEAELYRSVTSALATETVTVLPTRSIVQQVIDDNYTYIYFGTSVALFLLLFAVIGIGDNLLDSFNSRRADFALFGIAGMDKKAVRRMIRSEALYTAVFIPIVWVLFSVVILFFARECLLAYGTDALRTLFL